MNGISIHTRVRYLALVAIALGLFALGVRGVDAVVDAQRTAIIKRAAHAAQCDADTDCMLNVLKHAPRNAPFTD